MSKRSMTLAEIQAMLDSLSDKITAESRELYDEIRLRVDDMLTLATEKMSDRIEELRPRLADLYDNVSQDAREVIDQIDQRIDTLVADVQEELAELKEVGLRAWIKSNPMYAGGIAVAAVLIIVIIII